jgi:copper chaperone CopZ
MLIDMTVGELEGVTLVQTDHAEGRTVVTYDDEAITVDAIIDAIRGAGYDASVAA